MEQAINHAITFETPCTTWEEAWYGLLLLGVPQHQHVGWRRLWKWAEPKESLPESWDPQEAIEDHLEDFLQALGTEI